MSKFSNGFPVNELGEIIVSSGTGSSNIVGTLAPDMFPVDNITGGLRLNKVAQLATDATDGGFYVDGAPYIRMQRDTEAIYKKRGGTADAGSVIQLAIDDASTAGEASVIIPAGIYKCQSGLDFRNKTRVLGAGMAATQLLVPTGVTAIRAYTSVAGGEISRAGLYDLIIKFTDPDAAGSYRGVHLQSDASGRVWKFGMGNVQIYGAGSDAIYLEGSSSNSVAECDFRNLEIAKFKGYGIYENIYTFDQFCSDVFLDGGGTAAGTNFGYRIDGGSGVYWHVHAVACGVNDGAGNITGGSFRVGGHYNQFFACHSDRPAGHGFVVGGYGTDGQSVSNDFHGCLSFNPGVTYTNLAGGTAIGACWKFGKNAGVHLIGGQTGSIGGTYSRFNKKGYVFEAAETDNIRISSQTVKNLNQYIGEIGASVPTGRIIVRDCLLRSNTGTAWSDLSKVTLVDNETT